MYLSLKIFIKIWIDFMSLLHIRHHSDLSLMEMASSQLPTVTPSSLLSVGISALLWCFTGSSLNQLTCEYFVFGKERLCLSPQQKDDARSVVPHRHSENTSGQNYRIHTTQPEEQQDRAVVICMLFSVRWSRV